MSMLRWVKQTRPNYANDDWDTTKIYTIFGTFLDGRVEYKDEVYIGVSYRIFKEEFNNCTGFFNMAWNDELGMWEYIQGCEILDDDILEKMK